MRALHFRLVMIPFFLLAALLFPVASAFADYTVTGRFQYEDRVFDVTGFTGAKQLRDIRFADVQIQVAGTSVLLSKGATGADGSFSIVVPGSTAQAIKAVCYATSTSTPGLQMEIRTYSTNFAFSSVYAISSGAVNYQGTPTLDMGITYSTYTSDAGKAFNIWDVVYDGMEFVASPGVSGRLPAVKLTALWRSSGDTRSFYYANSSTKFVHIGSVSGFDDMVIAHQFGHFLADVFSKLDSSTDLPNAGLPASFTALADSNEDVRLAWGEGVSMFIGASIRKFKGYGRPEMYVITDGTNLVLSADLATLTTSVSIPSTKGSTSVLAVAASLWGITNGTLQRPFSDVWKVLTSYMPNVTHPGISVEDFWDGWFSPAINNGSPDEMKTIFSSQNGIEFFADSQEPDDTADAAPTAAAAQLSLASGSRVLISEIVPAGALELFNAGDTDADLTGWTVSATRTNAVPALLVLPSYVLKSGAFVIVTGGQGTSSNSILYLNATIPWKYESDGACALRDSTGVGRDFVRWGDSREFPPGGTTFTGSNPAIPPYGKTLGRDYAAVNTSSGADWTVQEPSLGDFNITSLEKHHTFFPAGDVDYIAINATAGRTYVFATVNLTNGADTVLDLLSADGKTAVNTSDDYGWGQSSRIVWAAPASGKYLLQSRRYDGALNNARYGSYDVRIIESSSPLPPVTPEVLTVSKPGNGGKFQTISDALYVARNGDTVTIVDSEIYRENLSISGLSVNLKSAQGRLPTLDGQGQTGLPALAISNAKAVRIENLKISGGSQGIVLTSGSARILNLLIQRASDPGGASDGILIVGTNSSASIVNCTIVSNNRLGVGVFLKGNVRIVNSIIAGNRVADISGDGAVPVYDVKYSLVNRGITTGTDGNISADPRFVNAGSGDFHLQSSSACIDRGYDGDPDLPAADAEGIPRSLDGNGDGSSIPDMGAYEYLPSGILSSTAVFPQIAVGGPANSHYQTSIYGMNTGSQAVIANVSLARSDSSPLSVTVPNGSGSSFNFVISPGGTMRLETSSAGITTAGYAKIASNLPLGGSALFRVFNGSRVISEAGVGLSKPTKSFTVYIDNTNNAYSGYAIANFGTSPALLNFTLRDKGGAKVDTMQMTLLYGWHLAKFAVEHFPATAPVGFEGSIEVTSDQPVAAVALRYDNPAQDVFSTIPVLVDEAATTLYFPQVADGGSYRTNFILVNPSESATTARLDFFGDDGTPLSLPIDGSARTSYEVQLAAKGVARFVTDGTSSGTKVGWVAVTSTAPIGGSSIFQTVSGEKITSEAGVASSLLTNHFATYVESVGDTESGLAIANPIFGEANITLNLRDSTGNVVASTSFKLPARAHVAKFFTQWFPTGFDEFSGTLEVISSSNVSGVALRYDNREANVFATLPVVLIP